MQDGNEIIDKSAIKIFFHSMGVPGVGVEAEETELDLLLSSGLGGSLAALSK